MPTTPSITRSVAAEMLSTTRPPALRNAASALAVGVLRVEQHRVGGRAAAAQEGRRPQRVAAVVSRADDRAHPAAGNAAGAGVQLADDRGGQPEGRAPHQGAVGQAGQQRRFGLADRVCGVVMPHQGQHSMPVCVCAHRSSRAVRTFGPSVRMKGRGTHQTTTPGTLPTVCSGPRPASWWDERRGGRRHRDDRSLVCGRPQRRPRLSRCPRLDDFGEARPGIGWRLWPFVAAQAHRQGRDAIGDALRRQPSEPRLPARAKELAGQRF